MEVSAPAILVVLISNGMIVFMWWLNKPKQKREIEGIVADTNEKYIRLMKSQNEDLIKQVENNTSIIAMLKEKEGKNSHKYDAAIAKIERETEECRYQHTIHELEMAQLKKHNKFAVWHRDMVFVMDDDQDVLDDFRKKFEKSSVLDYKGFIDVDEFIDALHKERPPIVVLDYNVGKGKTAEELIEQFEYEPEIFIMSGLAQYEKKFVGKRIKFFHKDNHLYVYQIAEEIIRHLTKKT